MGGGAGTSRTSVAGGVKAVENGRFEIPEKSWHGFRYPTRFWGVRPLIPASLTKK